MSSTGDPTVLSYNDSLLRQSDVKLLSKGHWLNDNIIGFVFEYFATELFTDHGDNIIFIPPNITQFIKLGEGAELQIFVEPLSLEKKNLVLMAVNNNVSFESAGGSHWSFLLYHRPSNTFAHYDSMSGSNERHARTIATKIQTFLKGGTSFIFSEPPCPQQTNGSDCGMYVLCFAEGTCKDYLTDPKLLHPAAQWDITPQTITSQRQHIQQLITKLASKKTL